MTYTFEHVDTKNELVSKLSEELPTFGFGSVKVLKSDPIAPSEIPCIGINRLDDSENSQTISDVAGVSYDTDTNTHYKTLGTYFQESLEIRIWHTNADERDRLYRHLKAILLATRLSLVEKGLMNVSLRTGKDEQDTSGQNAPFPIFWSTITMSSLNPLDVTFEEVIAPVATVTNVMTPAEEPPVEVVPPKVEEVPKPPVVPTVTNETVVDGGVIISTGGVIDG